ncbi:hypothetical protein B0H14DRAFT_2565256 [Mycena olivaceomarginata]|nr:hypothetical protein B0H14DRAFT_2565256 [Mycena olivaceomarginata]
MANRSLDRVLDAQPKEKVLAHPNRGNGARWHVHGPRLNIRLALRHVRSRVHTRTRIDGYRRAEASFRARSPPDGQTTTNVSSQSRTPSCYAGAAVAAVVTTVSYRGAGRGFGRGGRGGGGFRGTFGVNHGYLPFA